jgi:DNA-binding NtrC family response regulator
MRLGIACTLDTAGYTVVSAEAGKMGLVLFEERGFDLVITDLRLPDTDGIRILKTIKEKSAETGVIVITAYAEVKTAVEAMRAGAVDYISKPFEPDELLIIIERFIKQRDLEKQNIFLKNALRKQERFQRIIGRSPSMQKIFETIDTVAQTDSSVIVYGESGTGKGMVADAIHKLSKRKERACIKLNCAAIPDTLIESELFGHEKGAFTGAIQRRKGKFEIADGGTIFLDEIGEIPLSLQGKLLRVLEDHAFERVGGNETVKVDVRTVFATKKKLRAEVEAGRFREDLFYRINVVPITLPPLRERREDIPLLIDHFTLHFSQKMKKQRPVITSDAQEKLLSYDYPGNVRELAHAIEMAVTLCKNGSIGLFCLPEDIRGFSKGPMAVFAGLGDLPLPDRVRLCEREIISRVIAECGGEKKEAARRLGISRETLWRKSKEHSLTGEPSHGDDEEDEP